jgi:hypothetical protein
MSIKLTSIMGDDQAYDSDLWVIRKTKSICTRQNFFGSR